MPFVIINDDVYTESAATLRLLASIVGPLTSYYPTDPFMRQKIDSALDWNGTTLRPCFMIIIQAWLARFMSGASSFDPKT